VWPGFFVFREKNPEVIGGVGVRCLIVDDEIICRKAVGLLLHEVAECDEAVDGNEAVAKFSQALKDSAPYDVVFVDILMPGIDGHETAKQLRNLETQWSSGTKVKIIMLTILNSANDAMSAFCSADSAAYLVKPASEEKFVSTFKELGLL
jgi:two-component system, chemotaxis family, chemotaxis protein CheY